MRRTAGVRNRSKEFNEKCDDNKSFVVFVWVVLSSDMERMLWAIIFIFSSFIFDWAQFGAKRVDECSTDTLFEMNIQFLAFYKPDP